jgi:putative ABC transport system substrate-binding protein
MPSTRLARRGFITGTFATAGAVALAGCNPFATTVAKPRIIRIGYLASGVRPQSFGVDPYTKRELDALSAALADLGYVGSRAIELTVRWSDPGSESEFQSLANQLVDLGSDVIVAAGTRAALAVKSTGTTVPVVFIAVGDPVTIGLAEGFARPGGTFTGFTDQSTELTPKQIQLLCEAFPTTKRVAVLWQPESSRSAVAAQNAVSAAHTLGVEAAAFEIVDANLTFGVLESARAWGLDALLLIGAGHQWAAIGTFQRRFAVPTMVDRSDRVLSFATMSYGANRVDLHRRAADYVGRILRGASPASLPIQQPTTFDLVINSGLARTLGFTIPHHVMMQATEILP